MMTSLCYMLFVSMTLMFFLGSYEYLYNLFIYFCGVSIIFVPLFYSGLAQVITELGLYLDGLSIGLVILSFWISLLMIMSSYNIYKKNEYHWEFIMLIVFLMGVLFITFFVGDYLLFYFFFEISLIPTFFIIMGWGYQPERLQAGVYFIFYTLTASLPLLLGLVLYSESFFSVKYFYLFMLNTGWGYFTEITFNLIISLIFIVAFLVKLPVFYAHLWLPSAHVEAPVAGSMILAGVLLKLGGYGLMRISIIMYQKLLFLGNYLYGLSLCSMVFVGLICCRLNDFKALVAYSSVAHMAMVICGVMTLFSWGFEGSFMMMISHGVASSGLFCMVNLYYERLGSRSFYINSGLLIIFPMFSLMIFLLIASNIAAPPTINLMSEIFLMGGIMSYDYAMLIMFPLGSFLGAIFSIFMFSYSQHGKIYYLNYGFYGVSFRELHLMVLHLIPINFLILNSSLFFTM